MQPSCSEGPAPAAELLSCERLAFVPRGHGFPFGDVRCGTATDLLVDRYEVTRGQWLAVLGPGGEAAARLDGRWSQGLPTLPASGMTYDEAARFAAARGMRLPTVSEWMYVASGPRAQFWPYGNSREASVANTSEVGLGHLVAVGTFPNGRTSGTGVHDMLGNVSEWTSPPLPEGVLPVTWWLSGPSTGTRWVLGGSYLSPARPLYGTGLDGRRSFHARDVDPELRAVDVGLRCVVDAEAFVAAHASAWSRDGARERVVGVGREWGARAAPMLLRLASEPNPPRAIGWLLEGARR